MASAPAKQTQVPAPLPRPRPDRTVIDVQEPVVAPVAKSTYKTYTLKELQKRYEDLTAIAVAECSFSTEAVGGQPAGREGVEAFVRHHLRLVDADAEDAIARIMREEIGERDVPSETGELKEKLAYSINVIRRDELGPYLGNWMCKACLKSAASRIGLFMAKRGVKGDLAEMGQLHAHGISLLDTDHPERIYLRDKSGKGPAETYFQTLRGRVQSPQGSKSIVNDVETVASGSRFGFAFRFYPKRLTADDVADMFASAMIVGLGSAKAFERGKFSINSLTVANL